MTDNRGSRPLYVISEVSNYDYAEGTVWFVSHNIKDTIRRFKFLYNFLRDDFVDDEGELYAETYFDLKYNIAKGEAKGDFCYWYDDGECKFMLRTIRANGFYCFSGYHGRAEQIYQQTRDGYSILREEI